MRMGQVTLHIVPRARASAVAGTHGDAVKVRIAVPPLKGAANAELVRFLAACLGLPAGRVAITHGARGRRKTVTVSGMPSDRIRRTLLGVGR